MARPLRMEFPGAIYHVTGRKLGNRNLENNRLFEDDRDRLRFLNKLGEKVKEFEIRLYLLTLMANHFHLVLETPQGNLGRFMHGLSTAYTVYFNLRHGRHGHLLDGRYKARLVEGDEYLLALTRYVHLNPVHTKAMSRKPLHERIDYLRGYRWSSYPGYIGLCKPFEWIDRAPILAQMNCAARRRQGRYREYVESGLAESDEEFKEVMSASPLCIGSVGFRERILEMYKELTGKRSRPEDVSFRKIIRPLEAQEVLGVVAEVFGVGVETFGQRKRGSPLRGTAARMLSRFAGKSQREVAGLLGIGSGSAVSRQMNSLEEQLERDRHLRKQVEACVLELTKRRKS